MNSSADVGTMVQPRGLVEPPSAAKQPTARNPLRWFVFAVVIAANIMDLMDATIVNVAGPSIRHCARRQRLLPAVAACRLHAGVRGVPDHRRPAG
jgi:hypothetical protein